MPRASKTPDWHAKLPALWEAVAKGGTLRELCRQHGIDRNKLYALLEKDDGQANQYARARERQAQSWADDLVATSEAAPDKVLTKFGEAIDPGWVAHQRLKVDTKKWLMARAHPKLYGEKLDVTSKGEQVRGVVVLPANENAPS